MTPEQQHTLIRAILHHNRRVDAHLGVTLDYLRSQGYIRGERVTEAGYAALCTKLTRSRRSLAPWTRDGLLVALEQRWKEGM